MNARAHRLARVMRLRSIDRTGQRDATAWPINVATDSAILARSQAVSIAGPDSGASARPGTASIAGSPRHARRRRLENAADGQIRCCERLRGDLQGLDGFGPDLLGLSRFRRRGGHRQFIASRQLSQSGRLLTAVPPTAAATTRARFREPHDLGRRRIDNRLALPRGLAPPGEENQRAEQGAVRNARRQPRPGGTIRRAPVFEQCLGRQSTKRSTGSYDVGTCRPALFIVCRRCSPKPISKGCEPSCAYEGTDPFALPGD